MVFKDVFFLSFRAVKGNKLRSGLTILIIAFGIMALVWILTAIASIKTSIFNNFASMGANGFTIHNQSWQFRFGGGGNDIQEGNKNEKKKVKTSDQNLPITYEQAVAFKEKFNFPALVGISITGSGTATATHGGLKTNPNVRVIGGDENYLKINGYGLDLGRDFNALDIQSGRDVAIIGNDLVKRLFAGKDASAINNEILVGTVRYRVIGILTTKGNTGMFSADNVVITTVNNVRRVFTMDSPSFQLAVYANDMTLVDPAVSQATGIFRIIRKLQLNEQDNFEITKSDSLASMLAGSLNMVNYAAIAIAIITLVGSLIGLMNMMLVAVAERTREIGVNKALGATKSVIARQFIMESIIISVLGGLVGIILGVLLGNLVSLLINSSFVVPWFWVCVAIITCTLVGLASGLYPAMKAARLDPIVALRYE
ncbi:MAG TPA: ABC transporter permease [Chitinophagaceae bacterium]|nr:ABC transporter permease [Chitinophagaceae bacterium]